MQLTILKTNSHFVVWVDDQSVKTGPSIENIFGQLSLMLEDAVRSKEPIIGSFETSYHGKEYYPPTTEEITRARTQLEQFHGILTTALYAAEAPL